MIDPCLECSAGKCRNCDGTAWDHEADGTIPCPCALAGHDSLAHTP